MLIVDFCGCFYQLRAGGGGGFAGTLVIRAVLSGGPYSSFLGNSHVDLYVMVGIQLQQRLHYAGQRVSYCLFQWFTLDGSVCGFSKAVVILLVI